MAPKINLRFVTVRGVNYLRAEDVRAFIEELAAGEEVDVRKRIEEGARRIEEGLPR